MRTRAARSVRFLGDTLRLARAGDCQRRTMTSICTGGDKVCACAAAQDVPFERWAVRVRRAECAEFASAAVATGRDRHGHKLVA